MLLWEQSGVSSSCLGHGKDSSSYGVHFLSEAQFCDIGHCDA